VTQGGISSDERELDDSDDEAEIIVDATARTVPEAGPHPNANLSPPVQPAALRVNPTPLTNFHFCAHIHTLALAFPGATVLAKLAALLLTILPALPRAEIVIPPCALINYKRSPNLSDDSSTPRMQRQAIRQGSAVRAYSRRVVNLRISSSLPYSHILSTAALAPPHPILDCSTWSWTSSTNPCQISNKCSI
jgi:hypothetical protein